MIDLEFDAADHDEDAEFGRDNKGCKQLPVVCTLESSTEL
jgi:hypothetical protein